MDVTDVNFQRSVTCSDTNVRSLARQPNPIVLDVMPNLPELRQEMVMSRKGNAPNKTDARALLTARREIAHWLGMINAWRMVGSHLD